MSRKGYYYLGLAVFVFSTMETVSKLIVNDFHPLQLNFLRFLIGGLALLPFAIIHLKKENIKLTVRDIAVFAGIGMLAVPLSMSLFQISITYTKASIIAVLISSNAIFVAPFSYFILGERIDRYTILGLLFGVTGMLVIGNPSSAAGKDFIGILYGAGASVTFALYSVLGKKVTPKFGGIVLNSFAFISGSIALMLVLIFCRIPVFSGIKGSNIIYVLYLGIVVSGAAYIWMFKGLSILPANKGSLVFFIKPVLAGSLAYLLLRERFSTSLITGTVFILAGIFTTIIAGSHKQMKKLEL
jgi:drug/metabolite transporter (DMT)-like permease